MLNILDKNNKIYPGSKISTLSSGVEQNILSLIDSSSGTIKFNNISVCNTGNSNISIDLFTRSTPSTGSASIGYLYKSYTIASNNTINFVTKNKPLYMDISSNNSLYIKYNGSYKLNYYLNYDLINSQSESTGNIFQIWFDNISPTTELNSISSGDTYFLSFNVYSSDNSMIKLSMIANSGLLSGCFSSQTGCLVNNGYRFNLSGIASNKNIQINATASPSGSGLSLDSTATLARSWSIV